jgi:hypothetical protein
MITGKIQNENRLENQSGSHVILENYPTLMLTCIAHVVLALSSLLWLVFV